MSGVFDEYTSKVIGENSKYVYVLFSSRSTMTIIINYKIVAFEISTMKIAHEISIQGFDQDKIKSDLMKTMQYIDVVSNGEVVYCVWSKFTKDKLEYYVQILNQNLEPVGDLRNVYSKKPTSKSEFSSWTSVQINKEGNTDLLIVKSSSPERSTLNKMELITVKKTGETKVSPVIDMHTSTKDSYYYLEEFASCKLAKTGMVYFQDKRFDDEKKELIKGVGMIDPISGKKVYHTILQTEEVISLMYDYSGEKFIVYGVYQSREKDKSQKLGLYSVEINKADFSIQKTSVSDVKSQLAPALAKNGKKIAVSVCDAFLEKDNSIVYFLAVADKSNNISHENASVIYLKTDASANLVWFKSIEVDVNSLDIYWRSNFKAMKNGNKYDLLYPIEYKKGLDPNRYILELKCMEISAATGATTSTSYNLESAGLKFAKDVNVPKFRFELGQSENSFYFWSYKAQSTKPEINCFGQLMIK